MSLILDALKKLEHDKALRKLRQTDIRPAITGVKNNVPSPQWRLPILVASAVILAVLVTILSMGGFSPKVPKTITQANAPSPESLRVTAAPAAPAPVPSIQSPPAAAPLPHATPRPGTVQSPRLTAKIRETVSNMAAPADIKVTGIAWQDERTVRRAVVNGSLVGEGSVVSGARITEIRTDQVRFVKDGGSFVVPITSVNR